MQASTNTNTVTVEWTMEDFDEQFVSHDTIAKNMARAKMEIGLEGIYKLSSIENATSTGCIYCSGEIVNGRCGMCGEA